MIIIKESSQLYPVSDIVAEYYNKLLAVPASDIVYQNTITRVISCSNTCALLWGAMSSKLACQHLCSLEWNIANRRIYTETLSQCLSDS